MNIEGLDKKNVPESDLVSDGRVEEGVLKASQRSHLFDNTHGSEPVHGKVSTVEMHHQRPDQACPSDNVTLNIKRLDKNNMPRSGDVKIKAGAAASAASGFEGSAHQLRGTGRGTDPRGVHELTTRR